jgi:hypothetical protein
VDPVGAEEGEALLCLKIGPEDHADLDLCLAVSIATD